jgi:putative glutamine amidotransferase
MKTMDLRRPVIGIPCARYPDSWHAPSNGNSISCIQAVEAAGGIPSLIHQTRDPAILEYHYRRCDALLFAGGEDIDPSCYGHERHPRLGSTNKLQDEVEIRLVQRAVTEHKPVLALSRGLQLLNVAFGGTLYQDLPNERPSRINHNESNHRFSPSHCSHPIRLVEGSWLASQLGVTELQVNSLHHQAIRELAPGLRIVAQAPDGLIEGVEGMGPSLLVGVQCHPEELWQQADTRWFRVFEQFVAQAAYFAAKHRATELELNSMVGN